MSRALQREVTIIIAAVISGFAGGLVTSQTAAPSASFDVSLTDESIELVVRSLSEDIPSKDISIVLSNTGGTWKWMPGAPNSTVPFGFNIVEQGKKEGEGIGFKDSDSVGTENIGTTQAAHENNSVQWFGNYTLKAGSRMGVSKTAFSGNLGEPLPEGIPQSFDGLGKGAFIKALNEDRWKKVFGDDGGVSLTQPSPMTDNVIKVGTNHKITNAKLKAFLEGKGVTFNGDSPSAQFYATSPDEKWDFGSTITYGDGGGGISISPGDRVTVTIVHTPSGQTMFTKTVTVKEA